MQVKHLLQYACCVVEHRTKVVRIRLLVHCMFSKHVILVHLLTSYSYCLLSCRMHCQPQGQHKLATGREPLSITDEHGLSTTE